MTFVSGQLLTAAELNSIATNPLPNLYYTVMPAGDIWITANAAFDGTNWNRINPALYAYAMVFQWASSIPGEMVSNTATMFLRCVPGSNPMLAFLDVGGWETGFLFDQFRHLIVGGFGVEIDGSGTSPFGRLTHWSNGGSPPVYTGLLKNMFVDFSGTDSNSDPSWFAGMIDDDGFTISRAQAGSLSLAQLWQCGNTGLIQENASSVVGAASPGTQLFGSVNIVTSVGAGSDVQLITGAPGLKQAVVNTTASSVTVNPPATGSIANASTATIAGYGARQFWASDATHWF